VSQRKERENAFGLILGGGEKRLETTQPTHSRYLLTAKYVKEEIRRDKRTKKISHTRRTDVPGGYAVSGEVPESPKRKGEKSST